LTIFSDENSRHISFPGIYGRGLARMGQVRTILTKDCYMKEYSSFRIVS
jgi:hypothetical protein